MNQIHIIKPYRSEIGLWLFDDPKVGLLGEPFVSDMSEIIDLLTESIANARTEGFVCLFSEAPFKGAVIEFTLIDTGQYGGSTYRCEQTQTEGWLCPALFRYFPEAPKKIFCQFLPKTGGIKTQNERNENEKKEKSKDAQVHWCR